MCVLSHSEVSVLQTVSGRDNGLCSVFYEPPLGNSHSHAGIECVRITAVVTHCRALGDIEAVVSDTVTQEGTWWYIPVLGMSTFLTVFRVMLFTEGEGTPRDFFPPCSK